MERHTTSFRVVAGAVLAGALAGVAATLVVLKGMGVPFDASLRDASFRKFYTAYEDLRDRYYRSLTDQTLLDGAVQGMANATGDPFTAYFPPADAKSFQNMLQGAYVGIGASVEKSGKDTVIVSVQHGSPAEQGGLRAHDVIVKVNGQDVTGWALDKVSQAILGPEGTQVTLTLRRPSENNRTWDVKLTRRKVSQQTVFTQMMADNVGYLGVVVVSEHTSTEVAQALADLRKQGARSIIVDLRGNPGGYLDQAVDIASDFIAKGKVVVKTEDRQGHQQVLTSKGPGLDLPVVVLMDQNTASAAEILAAALHDDNGAPLVGTRSFGKGTVQDTQSFPDGSALKYTVGKWLTPDGAWIHGKGLQPTDPVDGADAQLKKAQSVAQQLQRAEGK
ncbi:S41 family peptidase [Alicyclobacillus macrosporangiidus]|uniref:Carboxyl-terminal processing protease n=1 Tax=Alicyclobacillus macrosporangiidus TaxID=392015 RepID=A0A1I7K130_9BACL|nr:S41 family peptidase [Alicyclobacillus macrosporangiidus]SFU91137.1 carboxyl-terminal processing protease [Alicyclobacillus macrosporangiidus]